MFTAFMIELSRQWMGAPHPLPAGISIPSGMDGDC